MHLVYIDEVKFAPPSQPYHWLCALAFPEDSIQGVDAALSRLATSYFGTPILDAKNEFHGRDIVHGKGVYKGRPMAERVDLYEELLNLIDETEGLGRIEVRVEPEKMVTSGYEDMAFMFLIEKVDSYMVELKSLALLIADEDKELAGTNVASLSAYKVRGTSYAFGRAIHRVVDTIHHTRSHHSRLLQLADIYVYTLAMVARATGGYPRDEIVRHAKSKANLLFPTKYKHWPTEGSWYLSPMT